MQFVICTENKDCDDLTPFKIYPVISDKKAAEESYIRVIDESGEDYLYPESYFLPITVTKEIEMAILKVA